MKTLNQNTMSLKYKVIWTKTAELQFDEILDYLQNHFTDKEVINYKRIFFKIIDLIEENPFIFKIVNDYPNYRKALPTKHNTIIYSIKDDKIYINLIFNNFQNPKKLDFLK